MKNIFLIITVIFVLTACTSHETMDHPQVTSEEIFIAEMIPHHQEAVDSSLLMLESQNTQVKSLAESIVTAQEQEVSMMQEWMRQWYPDSNYTSMYQNMMPDLTSLEGDDKDEAYLKGMIDHHEGAIMMAKQAQELELRSEVFELTENIISTQEDEITQINQLLDNLDN
ncbi:conserved exported protein of unknown function [Petrocella atlantisensis]|uniref:DUF305 domain-containing protein n=1 Tax=Petrocella atlantisensis TaxID=2173034 RepID=A0A3P7S177_9FIRM|nr:DUF305 domain-containing protein [Petrocella atlantisensis]VDN46659.1 conserved exported protein of unknown function [Petrocella atlantisensis]